MSNRVALPRIGVAEHAPDRPGEFLFRGEWTVTTHPRHAQALAAVLAAIAGYVDASGFLAIGGYFVSFMSGNSTRLGIDALSGLNAAGLAAMLIGSFLFGVVAGALVGHVSGTRRKPATLVSSSVLLAGAAACASAGRPGLATATLMAAAMGALNNVFERNGEVSIGLTYMTGSIVKLGQRIAAACLGQDRFGWISYLGLWASFVAGATAAAAAYPVVGLTALWGCSALLFGLSAATWLAEPAPGPGSFQEERWSRSHSE